MVRKKAMDARERREFEERIRRFAGSEGLIRAGDCVIAGVSGGADSVCLLRLLLRLREQIGCQLKAVHVEHGIRGEESLRDAAFTERLCGRLGVPCEVFHVRVPEYAAGHRIGYEEAARALRYACYEKAAQAEDGRPVRIALAHHADDNAETVLLWLARGSGLQGLGGMRALRQEDGGTAVIRPLLCAQREELVRYLDGLGQEYCEDTTNADTGYSRNRIRHEVLPQLKQVNPQAVAHIGRSAGMIAELAEYLEAETERVRAEVCVRVVGPAAPWGQEEPESGAGQPWNQEEPVEPGIAGGTGQTDSGEESGWLIRQELFLRYPAVLQKAVVYQTLCDVCGSSRDIGSVHVGAVCGLASHQAGRRLSLPYCMMAERVYEGIRIRVRRPQAGNAEGGTEDGTESYPVTAEALSRMERGEILSFDLPDGRLVMRIFSCETDGPLPAGQNEAGRFEKKKYTKWLSYDKIKDSLQIRRRMSGDFLTIDDNGHRKKLREYLIGEKIPAEQRDRLWLLTEGHHVIWVVGGRISAHYKIGQDTHRVLEVQMIQKGRASSGRTGMEEEDED